MRFAGSLLGTVSARYVKPAEGIKLLTFLFLVWYFFSDVYPSLHGGQRPLDPPQFWRNFFERPQADTGAAPIDNEIAAAAAPEVR